MAGNRRPIIVAFVVMFIAALPGWWHLTLVYRAPLPYAEMQSAHEAVGPDYSWPLNLDVYVDHSLMKSSAASSSTAGNFSELEAALRSAFLLDSHQAWDQALPKISWTLRMAFMQSRPENMESGGSTALDEELHELLPATARAQHGHYALYILRDEELRAEPAVTIGIHRHAWIRWHEMPNASTISAVAHRGFVWGTMQQLPSPPPALMRLSFTLLNSEPSACNVRWRLDEALETTLQPVLAKLARTVQFVSDSQVLYHSHMTSRPQLDPKSKQHYVSETDLQYFVNSNDWSVDSPATAERTMRFLLFVPAPQHTPLRIGAPTDAKHEAEAPTDAEHEAEAVREAADAFRVHKFGGVLLYNAPTSCDITGLHELGIGELHPFIQIVVAQLREELGLTGSLSGWNVLGSADNGISEWELDVMVRHHTWTRLQAAVHSMRTLSGLIHDIGNMVVLDEIHAQVELGLSSIRNSHRHARLGEYDLAAAFGISAALNTEGAFFNEHILSMLYFPDEHKLAVYVPLFVPVLVPLVLAVVSEVKKARAKAVPSKTETLAAEISAD